MRSVLAIVLCLSGPNVALCLRPDVPHCGLEDQVKAAEKKPPAKRLGPALSGLGDCANLGELAELAKKAAPLARADRAKLLASVMPEECKSEPTAQASTIAARCAIPTVVEPDSPALRHLDAATYGFLVAAHRALEKKGGSGPSVRRLMMTAVLAGALEGEALAEKR